MELKQGYKQTEFGLIPEDWNHSKIQDLIDDNYVISHLDGNHGALYPRSSEFVDTGIPYIGANDFYNSNVLFSHCKYLSEQRASVFRKGIAKDGDVLFAHNATVGPVALLKTNYNYVILSTTATYFRCNPVKLINRYLLYNLQSPFFVKQYSAVMSQSTRNQIPITAQRKLTVLLPPLPEQTAIANALSDMDALISQTEKLIEKKRAIKQGVMQELLKPKDGWVIKKLGEICDIYQPQTISADKFTHDGYFVFGANGVVGFYNQYNHKEWQVMITCRGSTCGTVNRSFNFSWITGNAMVMNVENNKNIDKVFFYYLLLNQDYSQTITGSGQPQIVRAPLTNFSIEIPQNIEQQRIIGEILKDIDTSIEKYENKLSKLKQQKQGMMQALLTGKIRLI